PLGKLPLKVVYHTPCHMEKMGWSIYTLELLRLIPGLELTVLDSRCCGIAGTYGFKRENYPTSQAIGAPLFRQIEESGADIVVTDCETCKWQIEMSTSKRCEHPHYLAGKSSGVTVAGDAAPAHSHSTNSDSTTLIQPCSLATSFPVQPAAQHVQRHHRAH
ncbi:hypothetical protein HR12_30575, partial [Microbacterium sp. SUBG005]